MEKEKQKPIAMGLMCVVCDRERRSEVLQVIEGARSFFNLATLGKGTANSKMLGYLGLGETEKVVFFIISPAHIARGMMDELDDAMELDKPGHGIAFTTRIHEGCYHVPVLFTGDANSEESKSGGAVVEQNAKHDLVMVVVNRGYTEEVMDVARRAGATGGTVLHARGCGLEGAEKFFGVTIQPEKELILIVADVEASCGIMAAIGDEVGPGSEAGAVSFSMPLAAVRGLRSATGEEH